MEPTLKQVWEVVGPMLLTACCGFAVHVFKRVEADLQRLVKVNEAQNAQLSEMAKALSSETIRLSGRIDVLSSRMERVERDLNGIGNKWGARIGSLEERLALGELEANR